MAVTPVEIRAVVESLGIEVRESGNELKLRHCPYCEQQGTRSPFAHFAVNADTGAWNCRRGSCAERGGIYKLARDHGRMDIVTRARPKTYKRPAERPELTADTGDFYSWYARERGISVDTLKRFGVGGYRDSEQWVITYAFRDRDGALLNRKYRTADKRKQWQEKDAEHGFYGAQFLDPSKGPLVVVEGEDDCHALSEMGIDNPVSVPSGTGSPYTPAMDAVCSAFDEVVLLLDTDQAGQEYARKLAEKIGFGKVRNGLLPYKDARECLQHGIDIFGVQKVIARAERFTHPEIVKVGAMRETFAEYLQQPDRATGRMVRIPEMNRILGGLRLAELTVIIGHTGSGKSTFALNLATWAEEIGYPSLIMPFENRLVSVVRKVIEIRSGRSLYAYDGEADHYVLAQPQEWIDRQLAELDRRGLWFLNKQTMGTRGYYDLDKVEAAIEYAVKFCDVRFVVVDHLHYFLKLSDARNPVHVIDEAVRRLKIATERHNVHIALLVHPSKMEDSRTGELARLGLNSSKGASSIVQECDNYLVVSKAKGEHPQSRIEILKNRDSGRTGTIVLDVLPNLNTYVPEHATREPREEDAQWWQD